MELDHVSPAEMARRLNISPASIQGMLNRHTLQVQKLIELSEAFQYNFFREIADKLPFTKPEYAEKGTMTKENEEMKDRIKALEMEVEILRQTLKEVVSR
jgi:hypothetical protein